MDEPAFFTPYFDLLGLPVNTRRFIIQSHHSRPYHGLGHLALMIKMLKEEWEPHSVSYSTYRQTEVRRLWPSILLAIFFHDIIYDARAPKNENEELSAVEMKLHAPDGTDVRLVEAMILATRSHHFPEESSWDTDAIRAFLMADLGILWTINPNTYAWYARGVRKEYEWVPNEVYRDRRAGVLDTLFADISPSIKLDYRYQFERNIAWEKQQLKDGALDV